MNVTANQVEHFWYPKSCSCELGEDLLAFFRKFHEKILEKQKFLYSLEAKDPRRRNSSNEILQEIAPLLRTELMFSVENGKKVQSTHLQLPRSPGSKQRCYRPDAVHHESKFVLELEAGGAQNGTYYKHLVLASLAKVQYLAIAVPKIYTYNSGEVRGKRTNDFFQSAKSTLDMLYAPDSLLSFPLRGVLLIGY